jgi:hypothetical protein
MRQLYTFIIKDNKYESYKKIASFLFLVNALFFIALAITTTSISSRIILLTSSFILFAYAVYNWKYKKKKERSFVAVYLLIAAVWIFDTSMWYFSILFIVMLFLQYRLESDFTIDVSVKNLVINGFNKKEYFWTAFNNVILKDGLLTIDFTTNKVLQVEPDWSESIVASGIDNWDAEEGYSETEKEFNDFCRVQLKK